MEFECLSPTSNPLYADLVRNAEEFFGVSKYVRRQLPNWNSTERPLTTVRLESGIIIDFDLNADHRRHYEMTAIYPEGARQQPASHFIEHMLSNPRGLGERVFRSLAESEIYRINGSTSRDETEFKVGIHRLMLSELHRSLNPHARITGLLYGMTIEPEFDVTAVARERERIEAELAGYHDDNVRRLADYIVPMISLGSEYAHPTEAKEVNYTPEQLNNIHQKRPHSKMRFEIEGNPMAPNVDNAMRGIIESINKTFGQLTPVLDLEQDTTLDRKNEIAPFPYGTRVSVTAHPNQKSNYIGIIGAYQLDVNPHKALAQEMFSDMANVYLRRKLHTEGSAYERLSFKIDYPHDRKVIGLSAGITTALGKSDDVLKQATDAVTGNKTEELQAAFEAVKFTQMDMLYFDVGLDRIRSSRRLGFPIENNCSALFNALRDIDLRDVREEGVKLLHEGRFAFIHYGNGANQHLMDYQTISEEELFRLWQG